MTSKRILNAAYAKQGPDCARCGQPMTPADSNQHPELFLHDRCLPEEFHKKSLREIGLKFGTGKISGHSYATTYEEILGPLRDRPITLCELGVLHGESIAMWLEYGAKWQVWGVDSGPITPCPEPGRQAELDLGLASERYHHCVQAVHEEPIRMLFEPWKFDVIVDDASHEPEQVWYALDGLWPTLKSGGIYVVEDVWSSRYLELWHRRLQEWLFMPGWRVVANFLDGNGQFRDDDIMLILRKP